MAVPSSRQQRHRTTFLLSLPLALPLLLLLLLQTLSNAEQTSVPCLSSNRPFQTLPSESCSSSGDIFRSLDGDGAHRVLEMRLSLSCHVDPELLELPTPGHTEDSSPTWRVLIRQRLPRELFVDPFEVERSPKAGVQVRVTGAVELEKPAPYCEDTWASILIDSQPSIAPNQRSSEEGSSEDGAFPSETWTISFGVEAFLPLHARYPEIPSILKSGNHSHVPHGPVGVVSSSTADRAFAWPCHLTHVRVEVPAPTVSVLVQAQDAPWHVHHSDECAKDDRRDAVPVGSWKVLNWDVPVGCAEHKTMVSVVTACVVLAGAAAVAFSVLSKSGNLHKAKVQ